jgi:hypothetical protein
MSRKDLPESEISAERFPALRAFLRGYFHQDMAEEYGSPEEATRQFCEDADSGERKTVAEEWNRFIERTRGQPLATINQLLIKKLGSARMLATDEELQKISEVFRACGSRSRG